MNNTTRNYQQNSEGRWFYTETETLNGRTYTNYYMNGNLNSDRDTGSYSSLTEEEYNQRLSE